MGGLWHIKEELRRRGPVRLFRSLESRTFTHFYNSFLWIPFSGIFVVRTVCCPASGVEMLERGEYGFLAMQGMNGYGYGIPLSYAMRDRSLYFHCAPSGFKLDSLDVCDRVSFCVVGRTK